MGEEEFRVRCVVFDEGNGEDKVIEVMKKVYKVNRLDNVIDLCEVWILFWYYMYSNIFGISFYRLWKCIVLEYLKNILISG